MKMENESRNPKIARVVSLINPSSLSINNTTSTSSMILDPMFPACEACSDDSANNFLDDDLVFLTKSVIEIVYTKSYP